MKIVFRILLLPMGLLKKIYLIAKDGSRDIHNKIRFRNSIIDEGCSFNDNVKIAPFTHILRNTYIGDSVIQSYSYIGKNCIIQNAVIGPFCSIAREVYIGPGKHPIEHFSTAPIFYRTRNPLHISLVEKDLDFDEYEPVEIGADVWIGARAIILDGVKIGHGAIIAANAVVTKDVPPYAIVGGIPAKIIKYRFSEEKIEKLIKSKWWTWEVDEIKKRIDELNSY